MRHLTNWFDTHRLPAAAESDRVEVWTENWLAAIAKNDDSTVADRANHLVTDENGRLLLSSVFGNSPYLARSAVSDPIFFLDLLEKGPDATYQQLDLDNPETGLASQAQALDQAGTMKNLRVAKRQISLITALADITEIWPLNKITGVLSDFAETAIRSATCHLLASQKSREILKALDPSDPQIGSGLIVLAMGKLGAHELNYSSDIDLIVFFDPDCIETDQPETLPQHFVRLTRDLVKILSELTGDGYVFRTDLRLRPDPGSTPAAISVLAAETYYESIGQNWERAAMIKARQVAGDPQAGALFTRNIQPFIWRKNLDFASIQDIHSIKRQIHAHRGGAKIAVNGHNIKLGRGGIREIEFFAQTQQLIWGGRDPSIRTPRTEEALRALAAAGHVENDTVDALIESYRYLRRLEHRLQMTDDQQTHTLPSADDELEKLSIFLGYDTVDDFRTELISHLSRVEHWYAELFEDSPSLTAGEEIPGNLIFTGTDDDPDTLETLTKLGFTDAPAIAAIVRQWHRARYRAMRSERTRQILTELAPVLLRTFGRAADPDGALRKFDEFLSRLPAGVQLFSMFRANPSLLDLVAEVMGSAPRLAEHLGRNPALLESVLDPDFYHALPGKEALVEDLSEIVTRAQNFEDILDLIRRWANDRRFQSGVLALRGEIEWRAAAYSLSDIADAALSVLIPYVAKAFAEDHGLLPESAFAVLALGKLGGREMTPTSDLDLVIVYETRSPEALSDGDRPLSPGHYYARLTQRLINAITAPTTEGKLYEVDMRLRPSGNAGPIASTLEAFTKYHQESAWTWEHMAMSRARVIWGPEDVTNRIDDVVRTTLTRTRDQETLLRDVAEMRERVFREHGTTYLWEVKHMRGGLVDVEFMIQYLQLANAADHPDVLATNAADALQRLLGAGAVNAADHRILQEGLDLWQALQGILRLTIRGYLKPGQDGEQVPEALHATLTRAAGVPSISALEAKMAETAKAVQDLFDRLIAAPAAKLPPKPETTKN